MTPSFFAFSDTGAGVPVGGDGSMFHQRYARRAGKCVAFPQKMGVTPRPQTAMEAYPLLGDYQRWLRGHRGLSGRTVARHLRILHKLLPSRSRSRHPAGRAMAALVVALVSCGCQCRAWHCILRSTRQGSLEGRAILPLRARLGLRAGDVAGLRLSDIDRASGVPRLSGKSRCQVRPLPQDVGDPLLAYIEQERPRVPHEAVFLMMVAPCRSFAQSNHVSTIAALALRRAGISDPRREERPCGATPQRLRCRGWEPP